MPKSDKPISLHPLKPDEAIKALMQTPRPPTVRELDADNLRKDEDCAGNNAAFTCPKCGKVFLVSGMIHKKGRQCPSCGKSTARIDAKGKKASIEYPSSGIVSQILLASLQGKPRPKK